MTEAHDRPSPGSTCRSDVPGQTDPGDAAAAALWPGILYFTLVFAVGFVLGIVRVLVVVPVIGARAAELLETPLMVAAAFLAARWVVRRFRIPARARRRIPVGLVALGLMLVAETLVVVLVRGVSLAEYVDGRDPVSGGVYLLSLVIFSLMPWLVGGRGTGAT